MPEDMGPLPMAHSREGTVRRAEVELMGLLIEWRTRHGLTLPEELYLISEYLSTGCMSAITAERGTGRK